MGSGRKFLIEALIFSRDRALQLDGLLRSLILHCQDLDQLRLHVLYKATNNQNARQYEQLARLFNDQIQIVFLRESNFRTNVLSVLLPKFNSGYRRILYNMYIHLGFRFGSIANRLLKNEDLSKQMILLLVDDSLFIHPFKLSEVCGILTRNTSALGFSLRLGKNTTYCYMLESPQTLPDFKPLEERYALFDWTTADKDFGYPLEVSSSVYRLCDLLPILNRISFRHPNELETRLAWVSRNFRDTHPYLLCFRHSVAFANPVNKVQNVYINRAGINYSYEAEWLAQKFDEGYRLNVDAYAGLTPNACHQEVELILDKPMMVR